MPQLSSMLTYCNVRNILESKSKVLNLLDFSLLFFCPNISKYKPITYMRVKIWYTANLFSSKNFNLYFSIFHLFFVFQMLLQYLSRGQRSKILYQSFLWIMLFTVFLLKMVKRIMCFHREPCYTTFFYWKIVIWQKFLPF